MMTLRGSRRNGNGSRRATEEDGEKGEVNFALLPTDSQTEEDLARENILSQAKRERTAKETPSDRLFYDISL